LIQILHTHVPISFSARFRLHSYEMLPTVSVLHHPPLMLQMWYLNKKCNAEVPPKTARIS